MTLPATRTGIAGLKAPSDYRRRMRRTARAPGAPRWCRSFAFLATLVGALLLQSILVESHVHAGEPLGVSTAISYVGSAPSKPKDDSPRKSCLLCDQGALDGHGLVPEPIALPFVAAAAPLVALAAPARFDVAIISHLWRSRAPPR